MLWTGSDKYLSVYEKASDTFDSVVHKDLTQEAAVFAVTAMRLRMAHRHSRCI